MYLQIMYMHMREGGKGGTGGREGGEEGREEESEGRKRGKGGRERGGGGEERWEGERGMETVRTRWRQTKYWKT